MTGIFWDESPSDPFMKQKRDSVRQSLYSYVYNRAKEITGAVGTLDRRGDLNNFDTDAEAELAIAHEMLGHALARMRAARNVIDIAAE